jgi:hypothetical protein
MAATTTSERVRPKAEGTLPKIDRVLGHPVAFAATALVLLALYGWTFVANPQRVAPTKDPAYYTWRTEALISEEPVHLLEIKGAFDMFAGGYRIFAPVLGGFLRTLPGISSLHTTTFLMTVVPVVTALLLAGFAYRQRRDPLIFHAVAFGTASLYLTPPFVGYLDNILCLLFLAAAVWFLQPARASWSGRVGLFLMLLGSGFTHPTTLVIFCMFLGVTSAVRVVARRFDVRSVARNDAPLLLTAAAAVVATVAIWSAGIWGEPASLSEAALPPPYGVDFFVERLVGWVAALRPALNGPLFIVGLVGLLVAGRRAAEDELALVSIVWLAPLAGLFGFLAGFAYPYYRFFNTTLAWVLLVGVGAYFLMRFLIEVARRGGMAILALSGVVAIVIVFATNLWSGFELAKWNDPTKGWLSAQTRADLDALRAKLASVAGRPVVFVIDDETSSFQVWGVTKLAGNTSRYGVPRGSIDNAYLYLGSLRNFLQGRPTTRGERTYDMLSRALLADAAEGIEASSEKPIVVVAAAFNATGANTEIATGGAEPAASTASADIWTVHDGKVRDLSRGEVPSSDRISSNAPSRAGPLHLVRVLGALALMLTPGALAFRGLVRGGTWAEALGMVPALAMVLLALAGVAVLSVARAPFSGGLALVSLGVAIGAGAVVTAPLARTSP